MTVAAKRSWALAGGRPLRWLLVALLLAALCLPGVARKKKKSEPVCSVRVVVLRARDGQPIQYAGVVLSVLHGEKRDKDESYELKTSRKGQAFMRGLPCGPLRVQVIAPRMRTFGGDFHLTPPGQQITVRLEPPEGQISTY